MNKILDLSTEIYFVCKWASCV